MTNFTFSKDIPELLQETLKADIKKMSDLLGIKYKDFEIEAFKTDDSIKDEKFIVTTDNDEKFFALIKKDNGFAIEYIFNTIYFYTPGILTKDFKDVDNIKQNILPIFNRLTNTIKDKKNISISLNSFYTNELYHVLSISKDGKVLNNIKINENDLVDKLNKGMASLLVSLKLENFFNF